MEAALRTAHYFITGKELEKVEFENVRGIEGIKETEIEIDGRKLKIAVASGLGNVEYILNKVREAKLNNKPMPYDFIEVMACPGGCIGGGGQPYMVTDELRIKRSKVLYQDDEKRPVRTSHSNPYIKRLYKEFLEKPLSEKAKKLLHTDYRPRPIYTR